MNPVKPILSWPRLSAFAEDHGLVGASGDPAQLGRGPWMNAQTIPQSESKAWAMLRRDVVSKLRRITASKPKAKTGNLMGPRVYPWAPLGFLNTPSACPSSVAGYLSSAIACFGRRAAKDGRRRGSLEILPFEDWHDRRSIYPHSVPVSRSF